eukprot:CAMPEP_0201553668 /NCGR_PEP_ID=MMETSP0173_2-20130828/32113_1 /ASSEMBLY_ACC=CAM_ASM_000268 /TAXON_ID=218659 /ORGANISM="Vexillifera sp., Strain DIVA3 564/2" /LENGTH=457 /DNA_ID=CAMNT_0047964593 /DNA_START=37 /DNA_END=1407 /DNA_ORIENTATION=-
MSAGGSSEDESSSNIEEKVLSEIHNVIQTNEKSLLLRRYNTKSLPDDVFSKLSTLTELNLSWNKLITLPSSIENLTQLQRLIVCGNELQQLFEKDLSSYDFLKSLTLLELSENRLSSIPAEIFNYCTKLTAISLDVNELTLLPPLSKKAKSVPPLEVFSLSANQFTTMPIDHLVAMSDTLTTLNMSQNLLTEIPSAIGRLQQLRTLQLGENQIETIPSELYTLTNLTSLQIARNKLTSFDQSANGAAASSSGESNNHHSLSDLVSLTRLDVSFNEFTTLPEQVLVDMKSLQIIDVRGNDVLADDLQQVQAKFRDQLLIESETPDLVVNDVWLGSYNAAKNRYWLQRHNITHILTVAKGLSSVPREHFTTKTIHVEDKEEENLINHFAECIEFMEEAVNAKKGVLVHCVAGVSRSATVVIAYLMTVHGMNWKKAVALVREKRPGINPNRGFLLQLQTY